MKHNEKKIKNIYVVTIITAVFFAYLGGFVSVVKKYFPYELAKQYYYSVSDKIGGGGTGDLIDCTIPNLKILPDKFSVIIGHAYGAPTNAHPDDFIANSVSEFIAKNRNNILYKLSKGYLI